MMPTIYKSTTTVAFAEESAKAIESFLNSTLQTKPVVRLALSGGQSPIPVYRALAGMAVDWKRVILFLVDERYVPLASPDSNFRMIQKTLVEPVGKVNRFYHHDTRQPIHTLVGQYQALLGRLERPLFDLVILGLGADGHTASLFPGSMAVHENQKLVLHTQAPGSTTHRVTLTFPALLSASKIMFLVQGKNKESVVQRFLNEKGSADDLPARGVLAHPDISLFYCSN